MTAAQDLVAAADSGEQLKASLIQRFRTYRGEALLDVQNIYMFPASQADEASDKPGSNRDHHIGFQCDGRAGTFRVERNSAAATCGVSDCEAMSGASTHQAQISP